MAEAKNNWQKLLDLQSKLLKLGRDETAGAGGKFSYQYLSLQKLKEKLQPFFVEYGWVLTQPIGVEDGREVIITQIVDAETGEVFLSSKHILHVVNPNDPQKYGSAITYFRRYTLITVLGLVADKDDDAFQTDEDIKAQISSINDVDELMKYYKSLDADRAKYLKDSFTERKQEIISETAAAATVIVEDK